MVIVVANVITTLWLCRKRYFAISHTFDKSIEVNKTQKITLKCIPLKYVSYHLIEFSQKIL